MKWLVGVLLLGCATVRVSQPEPCETACGMKAFISPEACKTLRTVEPLALNAYILRADYANYEEMCHAISGYKLLIHVRDEVDLRACEEGWAYTAIGCVIGLTTSRLKIVELNNDAFEHNSYTHEIGHVLDRAYDRSRPGYDHCEWTVRGMKAAIKQVTGEDDENDESCLSGAPR